MRLWEGYEFASLSMSSKIRRAVLDTRRVELSLTLLTNTKCNVACGVSCAVSGVSFADLFTLQPATPLFFSLQQHRRKRGMQLL